MSSDKTVGFIDIGTNSIHLLVVKFIEGTVGVDIAREKESVRIGRSLYATGNIDKIAIRKTALVVKRFTEYAKRHGADEIYAFATCATREANNKKQLLDALENKGLEVEVISGEEEARLIKLGILGAIAPNEKTLLIDIGGGSTEFSISKGNETLFLASLPMGAIRFTYGYTFNPEKALSKNEYNAYLQDVKTKSYRVIKKIKKIGFDRVIGSSGTFETLADICNSRKENGRTIVSQQSISNMMEKLRKMNIKQRLSVPKLSESRADIIVAGGAIAEQLLKLLNIKEIEISQNGLKEGMKIDYRINHGIINMNLRDSSVNELCAKCMCDREHSIFVKEMATKLFDRLSELGLHKINSNMSALLEYAGQMHDVGEFISYDRHQINSYNIIINSELLGFSEEELAIMATLTRYHHKKMPARNDPNLMKFRSVTPLEMCQCICLLRMADAMDRHRTQIVRHIDINIDDDILNIELFSDTEADMEKWKLEKLAKDFKALFKIEINVVNIVSNS